MSSPSDMMYTSASISSNMAPDHVAFALVRFLADDCALAGRDFRRAVGGVVVIHVNVGARQCCLEITHYLADSDFLVVTGKKYRDGWLSFSRAWNLSIVFDIDCL